MLSIVKAIVRRKGLKMVEQLFVFISTRPHKQVMMLTVFLCLVEDIVFPQPKIPFYGVCSPIA